MKKFYIKNEAGEVLNTILASEDFVQANYEFFEEVVEAEVSQSAELTARMWRDSELSNTDTLVLLPDYPNKEALLAYRQALRDWPNTTDFPEVIPVLAV